MSKKDKRQRLLTKRYTAEEGNDTAFEFIEMEEINGRQYLYHRIGETRLEGLRPVTAEGCFPVSVDYVQEIFTSLGRTFAPSGKEIYKTIESLCNVPPTG